MALFLIAVMLLGLGILCAGIYLARTAGHDIGTAYLGVILVLVGAVLVLAVLLTSVSLWIIR